MREASAASNTILGSTDTDKIRVHVGGEVVVPRISALRGCEAGSSVRKSPPSEKLALPPPISRIRPAWAGGSSNAHGTFGPLRPYERYIGVSPRDEIAFAPYREGPHELWMAQLR